MDWRRKAVLFRLLDRAPARDAVHYLLQRHVTRTWPRRPETLAALVTCAERHRDAFVRQTGRRIEEASVLEIGSGRDLVVPLALRALGFGSVLSVDVKPLARAALVEPARAFVHDRLGGVDGRVAEIADLERLGIRYLAPQDVRALDPAIGVDLFVSNETLEHVPPGDLAEIFAALRPRLTPDGLVAHAIDLGDHFARGTAISRFNFYKYDDAAWRPYNSGFQYVNRLRQSEYRGIFERAGYEILEENAQRIDIPPDVIDAMSERFRDYDIEDLRTHVSYVVARPRADV